MTNRERFCLGATNLQTQTSLFFTFTANRVGAALATGAVDERAEIGGFTVAASDTALAACLVEAVGWLTDGGRIGYRHWLDDPGVFLHRARSWKSGER